MYKVKFFNLYDSARKAKIDTIRAVSKKEARALFYSSHGLEAWVVKIWEE